MNSKKCEHTIGIWYEYEESYLVTLDKLKEFEKDGSAFGDWTMDDYLNEDKETNLTRFDYCPYCGKKIDWVKLREQARK